MSRLHLPASALLLFGFAVAPAIASADSICIARDNTPMSPAVVVGDGAAGVGFLNARQCFGVLERLEGRTRVLVNSGGFRGEMDVANSDLLYILAEDIPLRLRDDDTPWGLALAGTGVLIEKAQGSGHVVRTVDGRMQVRFVVAEGEMLPAETWPELEPDEVHPGGKWPEAPHALPPSAVSLTGKSGTRATLSTPLFGLAHVLADPGIGALRYRVGDPEQNQGESVWIVGPTVWVHGKVEDIDWRRETLKALTDDGSIDDDAKDERADWHGWDDVAGYSVRGPASPPPREIASKEAPISLEPKGDRFAVLTPGARVSVGQTEGPWLRVEHVWAGGKIVGWLDKKRLVKEGKEQTTPQIVIPKATVVVVGEPTLAWLDKGPEFATDKEGNPKLDKEGNQVVDPYETHTEEPVYEVAWARRLVRERISRLRYFYGRALASNPTSSGAIKLNFVIDEEGAMTVEVAESSIDDDDISALINEAFDGLELPERKLKKSRRDSKDYSLSIEMTVSFSPLKG